MNTIFWQTVLPIALTLAVSWAGVLATTYIKDERIRKLVMTLVAAAEQIYGPSKGAEKKAFVQANAPKGVTDALIEAAVYETVAWKKPSDIKPPDAG